MERQRDRLETDSQCADAKGHLQTLLPTGVIPATSDAARRECEAGTQVTFPLENVSGAREIAAPTLPRVLMSDEAKTPCGYIMTSGRNGSLYTGVTSDLHDRVSVHKQDLIEGFISKYCVHKLVYYEMHDTMEAAIRREKQIKEWKRAWKIRLVETMNPEWIDLFDERTGAVLDAPAGLARRTR